MPDITSPADLRKFLLKRLTQVGSQRPWGPHIYIYICIYIYIDIYIYILAFPGCQRSTQLNYLQSCSG